ncbi:DNA polymerase III subunit gamma/tau [Phosphitispora fastidiosa]|uniref:DNA polymerase III subunit gamma/tau n=1 Tax=Phosphitispora fastidiosa TaxID=2837202 RepID=UPI001E5E8F18|nr:DNA polymerase III subunit gamma/tau [Phosphitispora fastidiosa]MBU7007589.1 DNA polymerase-3 subunit gamma/tau [Phosphitispora fastidiosa]
MSYVALYREWRPQNFFDIVGQEHISRTLQNALRNNRTAHAYLFCGPRGTGKTTTAKVMAKALNCLNGPGVEPCNDCENCRRVTGGSSMDVMEIDAASNRGIDEIRDLREKVKFAPTEGRYRIYIIDEVHMLTTEAFNALLKTLEEPPAHVIFVLATTEPHKIPLTILSRCQRFDFRRISLADIVNRLKVVVDDLGIQADEEALGLIARSAEGGMRDALSVLDQCISFGEKSVTVSDVNDVLGTVNSDYMFQMTGCFLENDVTQSLRLVDQLVRQGKDVRQFTKDLTEFYRNLLLTEVCADAGELVAVTDEVLEQMKNQASALGKKRITSFIDIFSAAEREMKWTSQPRLLLELAVIKAGEKAQTADYEELTLRIAKLEGLLAAMSTGGQTVSRASGVQALGIQQRGSQKINTPKKSKAETFPGLPKETGSSAGETQSVDTETIKRCWQEILDRIKKVRMSARAFLIEGEPVEVLNNCLVLAFAPEYGFHREKVEQPENRDAIELVIKEVTGAGLKIKCKFKNELDTHPIADSETDAKNDPLLEKAVRLFGGDVIEIED